MPPSSDPHPVVPHIDVVRERRRRPVFRYIALVLFLATGTAWACGMTPRLVWSRLQELVSGEQTLLTLKVDTGDVPIYVVESGSLESSNNTSVKCEVEALLGTVTSSQSVNQAAASRPTASTTSSTTTTSTATKAATTTTATTGSASATGTTGATGSTGTTAAAAAAATAAAAAAANTTGLTKPQIESFTYVVQPYTPLRGATPTSTSATTAKSGSGQGGQGGQGGGGGGGGGGQGGDPQRNGATRILTILPEGTIVKAGEVVCTLDSSRFDDELQVQEIRYSQAKSFVEQAKALLEVNQISLRQYAEGIYPKDRLQIQNYIDSCRTLLTKTKAEAEWGVQVAKQGLRSEPQLKADQSSLQQVQLQLEEALRMKDRLDRFTKDRIITNLKAKIATNQADLYAQQSTFQKESDRLRRIKKMIANCTLSAPHDGVVVYANQSNGWSGRAETQIQEGQTVRQGQPIFNLPDPTRMRVQVKVNESKVSMIRSGQKAQIIVDAFPNRPLMGTVAQVTAIPAPAAGPMSDVKVYYAMVDIDQSFDGLRPGMSAEASIFIDAKRGVTRIPVQSIRQVGETSFAAIPDRSGFRWQRLELGTIGSEYAEVRSGLRAGESVVADPQGLLPSPRPESVVRTAALAHPSQGLE